MRKKGQITIFIIIGVAILMLALFYVFFMRESPQQIPPGTQLQKDISAVDRYVKSCLRLAAEQSLHNLSKRGGALATEALIPHEMLSGEYVAIGIRGKGEYDLGGTCSADRLCALDIPNYPWPAFPTSTFTDDHYLGRPVLIPLEVRSGNATTIKLELEKDISEKMKTCDINEEFREIFNMTAETPNATVVFLQNKMLISLDYPLHLVHLSNMSSAVLSEFTIEIPTDFERFHECILKSVTEDTTDFDFDIRSPVPDCNDYTFNLRQDATNPGTDLITVLDPQPGLLYYDTLEFRFLRQNRIPALYPLFQPDGSPPPIPDKDLGTQCSFTRQVSSDYMQINGIGNDPDEDNIRLKYLKTQGCPDELNLDPDTGLMTMNCPIDRSPAQDYECAVNITLVDDTEAALRDYEIIKYRYTCQACCSPHCGACIQCSSGPCTSTACGPPPPCPSLPASCCWTTYGPNDNDQNCAIYPIY